MSYYEAARKIQKLREMEKELEKIRTALVRLERMIEEGEAV